MNYNFLIWGKFGLYGRVFKSFPQGYDVLLCVTSASATLIFRIKSAVTPQYPPENLHLPHVLYSPPKSQYSNKFLFLLNLTFLSFDL